MDALIVLLGILFAGFLLVAPIVAIVMAAVASRRLDAGSEGLPIRALLVDVGTAEFSRRVDLTATNYRALWAPAGGGLVYRLRPRAGIELAALRLPLTLSRKRWLRLTVHDGDSPALDVTGVRGEVRSRELVLRATRAGEHTLYVGDRRAVPPSYDLAAILARPDRAPPRTATLGALANNPKLGVEEQPASLPFTERHRTAFGAALAVVLVGLALRALRLLRRGEPADAGGPGTGDNQGS